MSAGIPPVVAPMCMCAVRTWPLLRLLAGQQPLSLSRLRAAREPQRLERAGVGKGCRVPIGHRASVVRVALEGSRITGSQGLERWMHLCLHASCCVQVCLLSP